MDAKALLIRARSLMQETTSAQARTKLGRAIHALEVTLRAPAEWGQETAISTQTFPLGA